MEEKTKQIQKISNDKDAVGIKSQKAKADQIITEKQKKILIVEDTPVWQSRLKQLFGGKNTEILSAKCLNEAVDILHKTHATIDTVVTDMNYPKSADGADEYRCGIELIKHVKENYPEIKVIAQSTDKDLLKDASKAGADQIESKQELHEKLLEIRAQKVEETRKIDKRQANVLVVTDNKEVAGALARAVSHLCEKTSAETCNHAEFKEKFNPDTHTHVLISADELNTDCYLDNSKDYEVKELWHHHSIVQYGSKGAETKEKAIEMDPEGKTRIIFLTCDELPEKTFGVSYLKQPLLLKSLIELVKM